MNASVLKELEHIAKAHRGKLLPRDVVAAARAQQSALHSYFTWDDGVAAEQWRLHQARQLIRVTVMQLNTGDPNPLVVRAFFSLTPDRTKPGGGYRGTTDVMADEELREQLLADALAQLRSIQNRYRMLSELAEVFAAVDKVAERAIPAKQKQRKAA